MSVLRVLVLLLLASSLLGVPFLIMRIASGSRESLLRIIGIAGRAAIALAAIWGIASVVGATVPSPTVTVPVETLPLRLPEGLVPFGLNATLTSGGFDRVTVTATGFTALTRTALALAPALAAATVIAVAVVVLRLARSLGDGDPFALSATAVATTGWVALAGGTLSTWAGNLADWMASRDLFGAIGWSYPDDLSDPAALGWPSAAGFRLDLPFAPLATGLALMLLAAVFRYGAQLRADAEGLV